MPRRILQHREESEIHSDASNALAPNPACPLNHSPANDTPTTVTDPEPVAGALNRIKLLIPRFHDTAAMALLNSRPTVMVDNPNPGVMVELLAFICVSEIHTVDALAVPKMRPRAVSSAQPPLKPITVTLTDDVYGVDIPASF